MNWVIKLLGGYTNQEMQKKNLAIKALESSLFHKEQWDQSTQRLNQKELSEFVAAKVELAQLRKHTKTLRDRLAMRGRKIASLTEKLGICEAKFAALAADKYGERNQ